MKKHTSMLFFLLVILAKPVLGYYHDMYSNVPVALYGKKETSIQDVAGVFHKYGVNFEIVSEVKNTNQLHVIIGLDLLREGDLPPYYIVYQPDVLEERPFSKEEQVILNHAIAIWDKNWENLDKYRVKFPHYYYFSAEYEYNDPVILPCFLPLDQLVVYKEILALSNSNDTDISSHLPIMFVHSVLQNPKYLMEIGVRSGQSTSVFARLPRQGRGKMIGIDIDRQCASVYQQYHDPSMRFFSMDDTLFSNHRRSFPFIPLKDYDLIFIDTSHVFDHTLKELSVFSPLLSQNGMLLMHDSNMSPLDGFKWLTVNRKMVGTGWNNEKGVARAIKSYFGLEFDESQYVHKIFMAHGHKWKIIHYPFCNGLTLLRRM